MCYFFIMVDIDSYGIPSELHDMYKYIPMNISEITKIRSLDSALPAFVSFDVLRFLVEKFNIAPITAPKKTEDGFSQ